MVQISRRVGIALGMALGILFSGSLVIQAWQLWKFVNQGARFTAEDGQALCLRIQAMEQRLYGSGETSGPCEYRQ
jgi:hypothetical protein